MITCRPIFLAALAVTVAACGDGGGADAEKFQQALQRHHDDHPECVSSPLSIPVELSAGTDDITRRQVEALAKVGLLFLASNSEGLNRYMPTAEGEKAIKKSGDAFLGGSKIYYARRKVSKVNKVTPIAEITGVKGLAGDV